MDHLKTLWSLTQAYHEVERHFITTRELCDAEMGDYPDSYIWLSYPMPDEHPETVSEMILSDVEEFPKDCLAGILAAILKNRVPTGVHPQGIGIARDGNLFRFCISGAVSLEDLRILCGRYSRQHDFEDEK